MIKLFGLEFADEADRDRALAELQEALDRITRAENQAVTPRAAGVELDEALVSAYSILSLLHHRGLVDEWRNREDVAEALTRLHPFAKEASQRMREAHERVSG